MALAALVSGVLLGCCFPPINATVLAWVALVPLGVALAERKMTSEVWAGVYLGGLTYHLMGFHWISGLYGSTDFFSDYSVAWIVASQIGAGIYCISFHLARRTISKFGLPICLGIPLFWLGFEFIRAMVALVIEPAALPWLRLGGTQVEWLTIAQVATYGGEGNS